jgi:[ribosomal protein S18]-alanine N-acetyltransferase
VEFVIRDFRPDDFTALWQIDQQCFSSETAYSKVELMHYIRRHGAFTVIAVNDGEIAGFAIGESTRGRGHVITLDVTEKFRRHGLGSKLMHELETRFRESGCEVSLLETAVNNLGAIMFYKRHGYVVLKTIPRYYGGHLDALLMGRKLSSTAAEATQP